MENEWDNDKNQSNIARHGISFDEAATALDDLFSVTIADALHSIEEDRFLTIGFSTHGRLLVVVSTERGDRVRIISARPATPFEKRTYENENS